MIFWGPPGTGKTTLARMVAAHTRCAFHRALGRHGRCQGRAGCGQEARRSARNATAAPCCSSTRCIASTRGSRTTSYRSSKTALSSSSARRRESVVRAEQRVTFPARVYVLKPSTPARCAKSSNVRWTDIGAGLGGGTQSTRKASTCCGRCGRRRAPGTEPARTRGRPVRERHDRCGDGSRSGQRRTAALRQEGRYFYDQISALHKSIRGSDPDASLYWLMRMLDGGCEPSYVARRMIRVASRGRRQCRPACAATVARRWETLERLGSPEGELALAQCIVYLACAAKSNAVYTAAQAAAATTQLRFPRGAAALAKCTDGTHAGPGLRQGLPLRS